MTIQEARYGYKVGDIIQIRGWDHWIPVRYTGKVIAIKGGMVHIEQDSGRVLEAKVTQATRVAG